MVLRTLRYRMLHQHGSGLRLPLPNDRAGIAVRAALSRLGRPYVWGATGPDQFDLRLNSHSRLNLIQALIQAIKAGADEALGAAPMTWSIVARSFSLRSLFTT